MMPDELWAKADRQPVIRAVSSRQTLRYASLTMRQPNRPHGAGFQSKVKVIKYSII